MLFYHDLKKGVLPDRWNVLLLISFLSLWSMGQGGGFFMTSGILFVLMFPFCWWKYLGWGDIKLLSILAFFIPLEMTPIFLILSGFFGVLTFLFLRRQKFPMGPAFIMGFLIVTLRVFLSYGG